jgi:hypothetical protein
MSKLIPSLKKIALVALVLAIGLASFPLLGASAASLDATAAPAAATPDNTRLELNWARAQAAYNRQGDRLGMADKFEARIQSLIDKATAKGWDTSAVQAAFDAFTAILPAAQAAHDPGAAIIASHTGFDASGTVTDRPAAVETLKALNQVLKNTRTAMNGTGLALRAAIRAFRDAHQPAQ